MDTSLVEGYVFLAEILYMFGEERQHVRLAVIGLFAERLVGQRADAAVALQGALADLEQYAQVLVVEKPDPVHRVRGFAGKISISALAALTDTALSGAGESGTPKRSV